MSRWSFFNEPPPSRNSAASQSSSSGMRRLPPHAPEVIRRIDEPAAEVILPDAIDDHAPRERVALIGDPLRQRRAARALRLPRRHRETCEGSSREIGTRARADFLRRLPHIASLQHEDRPRLPAARAGAGERAQPRMHRPRIDDLRRGQLAERRIRPWPAASPAAADRQRPPAACGLRPAPRVPASAPRCAQASLRAMPAVVSIHQILPAPARRHLGRVEAVTAAPSARFLPVASSASISASANM